MKCFGMPELLRLKRLHLQRCYVCPSGCAKELVMVNKANYVVLFDPFFPMPNVFLDIFFGDGWLLSSICPVLSILCPDLALEHG